MICLDEARLTVNTSLTGSNLYRSHSDIEGLLENYQRIAEQSNDLITILKEKSLNLYSEIRDLEGKFRILAEEKEKIDLDVKEKKKELNEISQHHSELKKSNEFEIKQLKKEHFLLRNEQGSKFNEILKGFDEKTKHVLEKIDESSKRLEELQEKLKTDEMELDMRIEVLEKLERSYEELLKKNKGKLE